MRRMLGTLMLMVSMGIVVAAGCKRDEAVGTTQTTSGQVASGEAEMRMHPGMPGPQAPTPDARVEYTERARKDLDNAERRLIALEGRAQDARGALRDTAVADLREARQRFDALTVRVESVPRMSAPTWSNEQAHLENEWEALNERIDAVSERLTARP